MKNIGVPVLPTISMTRIVINTVLIAVGWRPIRKGEVDEHKSAVLAVAVSALTSFLIYVSRTAFIDNTAFSRPVSIKRHYTIFLFFHISLVTIDGILGLVQIITAFKDKYNVYRKFGPFASVIWFCTTITGVAVYPPLHILYPGGETVLLIKATSGH